MDRWIVRPKVNNDAKIRLFCFPYAGSSAVVTYKFLVDSLPEEIEVCPVEFPGRGSRMAENLISDIDKAVQLIGAAIPGFLDKPYLFLGHSMGALVAFELSHYLKTNLNSQPLKLYLSAHRAPSIEKDGKMMHILKENEFLDELIKMNGLADEILEHRELLDLMLPVIKNDYKLCETYRFKSKNKLDIPFQIFGGSNDKDVSLEHLKAWNELTSAYIKIEIIEGDHFFLTKNKENFLQKFKNYLNSDLLELNKFK